MTSLDETIVALASASGSGERAVVRLSGPYALVIAGSVFAELSTGRGLKRGSLRLPGLNSPLPADAYVMPGPRSYTGQDCVELHTVSSPPLVDHLIETLLNAGARAARPGEFTMRAFLAGKKDLPQAEAVLAVIEADTDDELKRALVQMAGGLTLPLHSLRDDLLNLLADVEAGLDFVEEDITFVQQKDMLLRLGVGIAHLINLKRQLDERGLSRRDFRVALVGPANAGKSSLLNALTGDETAIVSTVAGTTRDYVSRRVEFEGRGVELIDTAGHRPSDDRLETEAQRLGREQAASADLVLHCVPAGNDSPASGTIVHTKADLTAALPTGLVTSAKTGQGVAELRSYIAEQARSASAPALAPSLARCRHHVDKAVHHLRAAHRSAVFNDPPEVLALELRLTLDQLGEMVGAIFTDDLLDRVFSRFCIGK